MKLAELFDYMTDLPDVEVKGLAIDSRKVVPGDMFFCLVGYELDGHSFAKMVAEKGAAAIVISHPVEEMEDVAYVKVDDTRAELSRVCRVFFGDHAEKLVLFGATGTNGKSTTTSIISDVFSTKLPCGYIGTIAVRYGDVVEEAHLTTPDQVELHHVLTRMADHGMKAAAIEVSSQGLMNGRLDTIDFDCAIFTNLTHDHLDYHKTMEAYLDAKKMLFDRVRPGGSAVLNQDDLLSIDELKKYCAARGVRTVTYGTGKNGGADYMAADIDYRPDGTAFTLLAKGAEYRVETNLVAEFNVYNLLAAMAAMHECGMAIEDMLEPVKDIPQVEGRIERIDEGQDFTVVVDYSHTPDGYLKMFEYAANIAAQGHDIYALIGNDGDRDHTKLPEMGRIAASFAKEVILTTQDPRTEDAAQVCKEMADGMAGLPCRHSFIRDREEAVKRTIDLAGPGDVVLLLGKGDDTYMYIGKGYVPFAGDHVIAHEYLKEKFGGRK